MIALALSGAPLVQLQAADASAAASPAAATTAVPRVDVAVDIDGPHDEPLWQQAAPIELADEVHPGDNQAASIRTVAYIAYTDDIGGTAFDARVLDARVSWPLNPRRRLRLSVRASDVQHDPALYRFEAGECPRDAFASPAPCPIDVDAHSRHVGAQLPYSYKANPRTALYAGHSHGAFDIDREDDALRDSLLDRGRSVFLKLSYAWQPGA